MSKPPVEVPQGAIRFNTDSQKMEFFAQDQWWEMATDVPYLGKATNSDIAGGTRGLFMGGDPGSDGKIIEYVTISTAGDGTDFGDMVDQSKYCSSCSSNTRGIVAGGESPSDGTHEEIEYVTISSTGDAIDFGDLLEGVISKFKILLNRDSSSFVLYSGILTY